MYYFCFVLYHLYIGCLLKMIYSFFTLMVAYCSDEQSTTSIEGKLSHVVQIDIFVCWHAKQSPYCVKDIPTLRKTFAIVWMIES